MPHWLEGLTGLLSLARNLWWLVGVLVAALVGSAGLLGLRRRCSAGQLERWCHELGNPSESARLNAHQRLIASGLGAFQPLMKAMEGTSEARTQELIVEVICEIGALGRLLAERRYDKMATIVDKALAEYLPNVVNRWQDKPAKSKALRWPWTTTPGPRNIVEELKTLLGDDDPAVRHGAALALAQYPRGDVVKGLGRTLYPAECEDQDLREKVAEYLGDMEQANAIPFLEIGLKDPIEKVRIAACRALGNVGQPRAIHALEDTLLPTEVQAVQAEAAKALHAIDTKRATAVLGRALSSGIPNDDEHQGLRQQVGEWHADLLRKLSGEETT